MKSTLEIDPMATVYVSRSPDRTEVHLRPVSTEPGIFVDAVWIYRPGETFFGLTFEQLLTATKIEIDDQGGATIVERVP